MTTKRFYVHIYCEAKNINNQLCCLDLFLDFTNANEYYIRQLLKDEIEKDGHKLVGLPAIVNITELSEELYTTLVSKSKKLDLTYQMKL